MNLQASLISLADLPKLNVQLRQAVVTANPMVEQMRCCFKIKDDTLIYYYTIFDWLDANFDLSSIEKFILYRPFNEN